MARTIKTTKYFYPPRPGNGAGTFSDNIVGLQVVDGGGLTLGNFEFTTQVVDKVNRTFGVGAFSAPISLDELSVNGVIQSETIQKQYRVYPNFDISNVLNFSLYGSLAKRLSSAVTKIINYFPAALDVKFYNQDYTTGETAVNISYDSIEQETYFEVNVNKILNPLEIDYTISSDTNIARREMKVSEYRNLQKTYLDYAIAIDGIEFKVLSFEPSVNFSTGSIAFYVSGAPFGATATTSTSNFQIRPNDFIVDKIFLEDFDEIEQFLVNRLVVPEYTAQFQVPAQNNDGQFYVDYQKVTWPKDGVWNLDIRTPIFDDYLGQLQQIAETLDEFKTNLISRFLTAGSLKEFDTISRKVERVFQIYGRSFDDIKKYIDGLAYINSVNYNPRNDVPSELLVDLSKTIGWNTNFSPIVNENFLDSIFGNQSKPNYPGYARSLTSQELNYAFYRNLILNSAYIFKSKGTRRSIEFLLNLIGAPESLIEYNEHIEIADQKIDLDYFISEFGKITGGTYVDVRPTLQPNSTFKLKGITYTAFTNETYFENVDITLEDYPIDENGYPKMPTEDGTNFFQKGAGWYEQTPSHRSSEQIVITGLNYSGQNTQTQIELKPFSYGEEYLLTYRKFPFVNDGFKLKRTIDNNKSWVSTDNKIRISNQGNYNAYYYIDDERLAINIKNIDLFLNPARGLVYEIWNQSVRYDYPIPESGLTEYYPSPGGVDSTFINPQPKKKTFFEFNETFWRNMINVRNRQFITDGKTGGYPTLQSLFWRYLDQQKNIGIQNNQYTYQKLIEYVKGLGPFWTKLVEQMIPATTIWQGGVRFENSILHKQKFVYRRQRGCQIVQQPKNPCKSTSNIFSFNGYSESVNFFIYP